MEDEQPQELDRATIGRAYQLSSHNPSIARLARLPDDRAKTGASTLDPVRGTASCDSLADLKAALIGEPPGRPTQGACDEAELRVLKEQNDSLRRANRRLVEEAKDLGRAFDRGLAQLKADLSATNAELEAENGQLRRDLSASTVRLKALEAGEARLAHQLARRDKEAGELADQLALCRKELGQLRATAEAKAKQGRPGNDAQTLALEIKTQRRTIAELEAENRRLRDHAETQARLGQDLQRQLAEIDRQLAGQAGLSDRLRQAEEAGRVLRHDLDRTLEDLIRLSNRLNRVRSLLDPARAQAEDPRPNVSGNPAILRKGVLLLAEEVGTAAERHCVAFRDLENELTLQRDLAERAQRESAELRAANLELDEERQLLEQELGRRGEELHALALKAEELDQERASLLAEKSDFLRQSDLEDRLGHAEAQLERCLLEKGLLEFSAARLKKYVADDRLLFYIDSWSRLQGEAAALEKTALGLELRLAKNAEGEESRDQAEVRLAEARSALAALDKRKVELEDRIRAVENETASKLKAFDAMAAELARVG